MSKPAGYSGKSLVQKLGIAEGISVAALHAPKGYKHLLEPLPSGVRFSSKAGKSTDLVHLFATERAVLRKDLGGLRKAIRLDAAVWVSWPKKASKVSTDITEDIIREVCLPLGFVDIKVCAVDATWSGLKLVIRRELR